MNRSLAVNGIVRGLAPAMIYGFIEVLDAMKMRLISSAAVAVIVFATGCSKPETAASSGAEKPAANRYQTQLPAGFGTKNLQSGGKCWVDTFNGKRFSAQNEADRSGTLTLDGWAIDGSGAAAPLVAVELSATPLGGQSFYAAAQRTNRRGLGEALKNPALDSAALVSTASLSDVPQGTYVVRLLVGDANSVTRCEPGLGLLVK